MSLCDEEIVRRRQLAGRHAVDHLEEVGAQSCGSSSRGDSSRSRARGCARRARAADRASARAAARLTLKRSRTGGGTGSALTRRRVELGVERAELAASPACPPRAPSPRSCVIAIVLPDVFWMSSIPMHERKSRMLCCQQVSVLSGQRAQSAGFAAQSSERHHRRGVGCRDRRRSAPGAARCPPGASSSRRSRPAARDSYTVAAEACVSVSPPALTSCTRARRKRALRNASMRGVRRYDFSAPDVVVDHRDALERARAASSALQNAAPPS